jgi:hypothetical protein
MESLPDRKEVRALTIDSLGNWYALVSDGLMYRSADSASSWVETGIPGKMISSMTADIALGIVVGTTDGHVSYSTDGGRRWQGPDSALLGGRVLALSVDSRRIITAGTERGVFRTVYYAPGQWTHLTSGLASGAIASIALSRIGLPIVAVDGHGLYRLVEGVLNVEEEVRQRSSQNGMAVHPNPSTSEATITFEVEARSPIRIRLVATDGRVVLSIPETQYEPGTHSMVLPLGYVLPGIYMITLQEATGVRSRMLHVVR